MSSTAVSLFRYNKDHVLVNSKYFFFAQTEAMFKTYNRGAVQIGGSGMYCSRGVLDAPTDADLRFDRFTSIVKEVANFILSEKDIETTFISLEDYALRAMGRVYPIGEYGGILRTVLLNLCINPVIRENEPLTIKLLAKGGDASKTDMYTAYTKMQVNETTLDMSAFIDEYEKRKAKGKKVKPVTETCPFSDLVDSWWIARLLKNELMVRWGEWPLGMLSEQVVHILNRTTKSYPVNVLNRGFVRMVDVLDA